MSPNPPPFLLYFHINPIESYMEETRELIDFIESHHSDKFTVIRCATRKRSNDMGKYLKMYWGKGTIIIIGQDNVPNINTLVDMKDCNYDLCVNPCISYPPSTKLSKPVLNQIDGKGKIYGEHDRPRFAHYGGTGVSKISYEYQVKKHLPSQDFGFPMFDSTLYDLGLRDWHCHYPISKHTKTEMRFKHWK